MFDVVIKAFGVAFLFLAIMAIPKVFEGIVILISMFYYPPKGDPTTDIKYLYTMTRPAAISQSIGAIIKFIIYIIASINFLRSGSLVKKLIGQQITPQEK